MSEVVQSTKNRICWADFSSDSDDDFPPPRTSVSKQQPDCDVSAKSAASPCFVASTSSHSQRHSRRLSTSTVSSSPASTKDSFLRGDEQNTIQKQVGRLQAKLEEAKKQVEVERGWKSRALRAERKLHHMESEYWKWSDMESEKMTKERAQHLKTEGDSANLVRLLEAERALLAEKYEECARVADNATRARAEEWRVWEEEKRTLNEKIKSVTIEREAMIDFRIECEETKRQLQMKRDELQSTLTASGQEKEGLRETIEGYVAALKHLRKDHNDKVQALNAKINSARSACYRAENKKINVRDACQQCSPSTTPWLQELNHKMVQKLVDDRQKYADVIRQKQDAEEQLDVANTQLDDMHCKNGTQKRELQELTRLIREATVQKDSAIESAECFHDQNKRILEERNTHMAQIRSLHKQLTASKWNDKITNLHGSRLTSILMNPEISLLLSPDNSTASE